MENQENSKGNNEGAFQSAKNIYNVDYIKEANFNLPIIPTPVCLSAGQPSVPQEFLGRDIDIEEVSKSLDKNKLLLINAEGGMGKTTLAAKYLKDNVGKYKHYAWLFCGNGIIEQIKTLAVQLKIDLKQYANENEQLLAIITAMQNLPEKCLLILDNANEPKYIEDFKKYLNGLHWHILLTSRCSQVLSSGNEYTLGHLNINDAKSLFKTYHDENSIGFDQLLENFLSAIGYNTLIIEILSKNLHEASILGETLFDALEQFQQNGLFLGKRSFEIESPYPANIEKRAATTDEIIEVLYDLTKLDEAERKLLVNLALLPAENHTFSLLEQVLTPEDKFDFAKHLKSLTKRGWLSSDMKSYRMSPVVQQIVLAKNTNYIYDYSSVLIFNLNKKLVHNEESLLNLNSHAEAVPFVELAESIVNLFVTDRNNIATLLFSLSDYYKAVGNFRKSMKYLVIATEIFQKINRLSYTVCLRRMATIYQQMGDSQNAYKYFEEDNTECLKLHLADPQNNIIKNELSVSYLKMGEIQQDNDVALGFFMKHFQLVKELFEANRENEEFKSGFAIANSKLGNIYRDKKDFKTALQFFKEYNSLRKEQFEANQKNELYKKGYAISIEKLGYVYQLKGEFRKALQLYQIEVKLFEELFEVNFQREQLKGGLANVYLKLGEINEKLFDFIKASKYYELGVKFFEELFKDNSDSIDNRMGLIQANTMLGNFYKHMKLFDKSKYYLERADVIIKLDTSLGIEMC